jgi:tetratricopeptide (TPR) repeat protein
MESDIKSILQGLTRLSADEKHAELISEARQALVTHPKNEILMGLLAATYVSIGLEDKATEWYQKILTINPGNALAAFQLGLIAFRHTRWQAALQHWQILLDSEKDFLGHFYAAQAHQQLGSLEDARMLAEIAQQRVPENHAAKVAIEQYTQKLSE